MSYEQNATPSHNIKTGEGMESIRSVVKFRYLRTAITNQNYIHEKKLLSKIIKLNLYISIILPVLYGCEAWSVTLRGEHAEGVQTWGTE
jgi:hypothetical protein